MATDPCDPRSVSVAGASPTVRVVADGIRIHRSIGIVSPLATRRNPRSPLSGFTICAGAESPGTIER